jgi:hypothetical protein
MKKILILVVNLFLVINLISIPTATAVLSNPSPVCVSGTCTINFDTTGDYYLWSAPTTGTYTFQVWGAQGGNAGYNGTVYREGGKGGYASGNYALTSGQTLYLYVGGQGAGTTSSANGDLQSGGFNGGGNGYNGDTSIKRGAGGGGATDIRISGNALTDRVIVAGGGAGAARYDGYLTNHPGVGGGTSGGNGYTDWLTVESGNNGRGGTQSQGGAGGSNGGTAISGSLGAGGRGVINTSFGSCGGGGGFYGGGGSGVGAAAGGGSGYVGGVTSSTITAGNASMPNPAGGNMVGRSGNGYIKITYEEVIVNAAFTLFQLAGATTTATFRTSVAISATVTVASKVTFRANGRVIPGCKNRTTSGSGFNFTISCSWKPSMRGHVTVLATADPVTDGISNVTSSPISVGVINRTGNR